MKLCPALSHARYGLYAVLLALLAGAASAQSAAAEPDTTLAFNAGVTTDYRFRGLTQTRFDPALQGGVDFSHRNGLYVGAWASSIRWVKDAGGRADAELDVYGGYKGSAADIGYDLGMARYQYPGHKLAVGPNTTELYGALSFGPLTAKYSHALTNTFGFANSKNSGYLELAAAFDLGSGWSLAPHVGHQRIAGAGNGKYSYTDYALTLAKDFGEGLVATVAALGTDAAASAYATPSGKRQGRDGLALGLKYSF